MSGAEAAMPDATGLDDASFGLLNAVHLKRMVGEADLAALLGTTQEDIAARLAPWVESGHVMALSAGVMLMPEGTAAVHAHYHARYASLRGQPSLGDWYTRFETLNTRFIAALTRWQQQGQDDDTLFRALEIVEALVKALDALTPLVPRYADYQRRFNAAIDAIEQGDADLLVNPRRDSAHNIWFEFHEDVLCVLGRPRDTT
jgi:hypothetical protein